MSLIQRFGSALNLNIHFHMLCLDGAYTLVNGRPGLSLMIGGQWARPTADWPGKGFRQGL